MSTTKPVLLINGNPVGQVGGEGGSGGHTIIDSSGSALTQESGLQFADAFVEDDPTNGKTVVENVKSVASADYSSETEDGMYLIPDGEGAVIGPVSDDYVEVTADGVKTYATLLNELYAKVDLTKINENSCLQIGVDYFVTRRKQNDIIIFSGFRVVPNSTISYFETVTLTSNNKAIVFLEIDNGTCTYTDESSDIVSNGSVIRIYYGNKKAVVDLQTTANRCLYDSSKTVKQKIDEMIATTKGSGLCNSTYVSSGYCNWMKVGNTVYVNYDLTLSQAYAGAGADFLVANLPVPSSQYSGLVWVTTAGENGNGRLQLNEYGYLVWNYGPTVKSGNNSGMFSYYVD